MNKSFLLFLLLFPVLSCLLTACNDNSLDSCPIANSRLFLIVEGAKDNDPIVTVNQFFEVFAELAQPEAELSVTWENPKDGFYIFNVATRDIATGVVGNLKIGMTVKSTGNAVLTDVWVEDVHIPALYADEFIAAPYVLAGDPDTRKLFKESQGLW